MDANPKSVLITYQARYEVGPGRRCYRCEGEQDRKQDSPHRLSLQATEACSSDASSARVRSISCRKTICARQLIDRVTQPASILDKRDGMSQQMTIRSP
jgi:hypothetical protein